MRVRDCEPFHDARGQAPQHARPAAPRAADDGHMPATREVHGVRRLALLRGDVDQPNGDLCCTAGRRQLCSGQERRQWWQPGTGRGCGRDRRGGLCNRRHQPLEVGDSSLVGCPGLGLWSVAGVEPADGPHRDRRLGPVVATGNPCGLEGHHRRRPYARIAAPRHVPRDGRGVTHVDDVERLGGVGDPQRDAQAGVGADVGAHRAAGSLGGEDEVDSERPATLGDADQAVDEVGQLFHQGRELVDNEHETRHRSGDGSGEGGMAREVVVDVLAPGVVKKALTSA